ncbi:MAG: Aldo/keto reductase [Candidatus Saccharibacteria bacterium]|nr:Aldo/keto reductase [Candidatus Saccharibacteria bacterium]
MKMVTLNNGTQVPQIGLGLWQVRDPQQFHEAVRLAFINGYRHFDTAQAYGNEAMFGHTWRESGIARKDFFVTTKIAVNNFGYHRTKRSFMQSLEDLETDYVDLLLLHFPVPILRKRSWKALQSIAEHGQARAIGVSNFTVRHLEELAKYARIVPAVNQVELHVFLQQPELLSYCALKGIVVEAYSPLAHARDMNNPVIREIAERHGRSYAQIMLRWCIQKGLIVLPKSINPERIKENFNVFDFELDADDMRRLEALDRNFRTCWSPVHVP